MDILSHPLAADLVINADLLIKEVQNEYGSTAKPEESKQESLKPIIAPVPELIAEKGEEERRFATLGIAYYNMGAELEFLHCYTEAIDAYEKGLEKVRDKLAHDNPIYANLANSWEDSKKRQQQRQDFHKNRSKTRTLHATKLFYAAKPALRQMDITLSNQIKNGNAFAATDTSFYQPKQRFGATHYSAAPYRSLVSFYRARSS